ncbi:Vacuolar morphogenesis protein 6 [Pichia californica]|uniref:Vacuolar morphogenesis protein 6 n=1 Tax=Pichia californica TaxID=460514 RepID=A0A9P6WK58_9ASCO|nr:Vacuolar morphogenesis protein 6 [[Candida] californica]KAG0688650.1 Vacuolar morphogenesis protein 6 [[Candida] californica]
MDPPLFQIQLGSSLIKESLKETPIALSSSDEITYIATQNAIYSTTNGIYLSKIFDSIHRIKDIYSLPHINIIIIVYDDILEIRNINNIENLSVDIRPIGLKSNGVFTWNNLSSKHISSSNSIHSNSDLMSLATIVIDSTTSDYKFENEESTDLISYIGITSKNQIVILKWINNKFVDRYNLYLSNIEYLEFINENQLICIASTNSNDLINVNLKNSKISHHNLLNYLHIKNSVISFNNNSQLANISYFNNRITFLKYDSYITLSYPTLKDFTLFKIKNTNFKYSKLLFPFIFLIYDNHIEIRSISDFKLFQNIQMNSIIRLDYHDKNLSILSKDRITILQLIDYNKILDLLYHEKDYDNAILLVENLDISNFTNLKRKDNNFAQLKFETLRKFQLLKAINLIHSINDDENFSKSMDIFIEYLAAPNIVISNISNDLKLIIENTEKSITNEQKSQIYQLIRFLTDSRRKLIKLLDNKYTIFKYNNLEISLSIYKSEDSNFSISENLKLLDNYLFDCYLLVNPKMINPFLRLKTFCDIEMVEQKCKDYNLLDQLTTFYYTRKEYLKSIEILLNMNKIDELVKFLQKIIQLKDLPINLIIDNLQIIINYNPNNFDLLLLNDNIDYSYVDYKSIIQYLNKTNQHDYLLKYLEYLIFIQNIVNLEIINDLFDNYLKNINTNYDKIEKLYKKGNYNANQILKKLKNLPISSQSKRLMIPPLMKLGKYDEVLGIFIYDLKDIKSCVEFCIQIRELKNDSLSRGLIFKIIDICLKNKDYKSIIDYILNNTDLDYINFEEILIKLPKNISINLMSSYLVMNMKKLNTENHNLIIKSELLKVNVIDLKLNKMGLERKMFKLTQNSICVHCGRNFNKSEIMCFHPNGDVVHYKCSKTM